MVMLSAASVVLSTLVGVGFLTPLFHVAAILPFYYHAMKIGEYPWSFVLIIRWAGAIFVTTVALGVFVPARAAEAQLLGPATIAAMETWLADPQSAPPADFPYLLWGMAVFLIGSVISGGMVGLVVGSLAVGGAAVGALYLLEHGQNVVQILLTALPPWQWALFAGGACLLVPAARPFFDRFISHGTTNQPAKPLIVFMYVGASCFLLSVVLRLSIADVWRQLVQGWTVF